MEEQQITLKPQHMTATSTIITPDKSEAVITFYSHMFTHMLTESAQPQASMQVRIDIKPELAISLTPEQAAALVKSLQSALDDNGLWKN